MRPDRIIAVAESGSPILRIEALTKRYGADVPAVLDGLHLQLARGEYLAVMGESGVGKSTLLNLLAGLDRPDSGRVLIDDTDITRLNDDEMTLLRRRSIGFVFQAFHVLPYLTLFQNTALPLDLLGVRDPERTQRTLDMLAAVGLRERAHRGAER